LPAGMGTSSGAIPDPAAPVNDPDGAASSCSTPSTAPAPGVHVTDIVAPVLSSISSVAAAGVAHPRVATTRRAESGGRLIVVMPPAIVAVPVGPKGVTPSKP